MMNEADDPVMAEYDIFVSTQLSPYLHIFQLPGNYEEIEAQNPTLSATCRYKRSHKLVELETVLDTNHPTYSEERGEELAEHSSTGRIKLATGYSGDTTGAVKKLSSLKLAGSRIKSNPHHRYFVATCLDNAIYLTPVETMIPLKPALSYLDEADAKTKTASRKLETDSTVVQEKLKAVQVQFRKRETEEQMAARLSSYAYLQRQVEDEPWMELAHFFPGTGESATVAQRLAAASTAPITYARE